MRKHNVDNLDNYFSQENDDSSMVRSVGEFILEIVKVVIISLAFIIPVRYFLIQPFYVKGASMEPNFYDRDYLIINEIGYRFEAPQRGDAIVFRYPKDSKQYFIKRIIGLPGEKIRIKNDLIYVYNEIYPQGIVLEETYLDESVKTAGDKEVLLEKDEYYVLGDNRNFSLDSRNFGPVTRDSFIGRTWIRGWPFNRAEVFKVLGYNL